MRSGVRERGDEGRGRVGGREKGGMIWDRRGEREEAEKGKYNRGEEAKVKGEDKE